MTFREATDGIPANVLARAFRVQPQTIRQYRLDPSRDGYRAPPPNWRTVVIGVLMNRRDEDADRIAALQLEAD